LTRGATPVAWRIGVAGSAPRLGPFD